VSKNTVKASNFGPHGNFGLYAIQTASWGIMDRLEVVEKL
jgi:hypothetical protein